jgi:hypothetical protein
MTKGNITIRSGTAHEGVVGVGEAYSSHIPSAAICDFDFSPTALALYYNRASPATYVLCFVFFEIFFVFFVK